MARVINSYKITITNWDKHNPKSKKGYPYFMVAKDIFNDHKITQLTPTQFQLLIYLFAVRADSMSNEFVINYKLIPSQLRMGDDSLSNGLKVLESFQILTVEKNDPLYRIEEKRIEKNIIERKMEVEEPLPVSDPTEAGQSDLSFENFNLTNDPESTADPSADFDLGMLGPKGANPVVPGLQGFTHLEHALSWVPRNTQRRWVSSYTDTFELRKSLAKAVEHISADFTDGTPKELIGWSKWLDGWLAKDKVLKKGIPGDYSTPELTLESVFGKDAVQ